MNQTSNLCKEIFSMLKETERLALWNDLYNYNKAHMFQESIFFLTEKRKILVQKQKMKVRSPNEGQASKSYRDPKQKKLMPDVKKQKTACPKYHEKGEV